MKKALVIAFVGLALFSAPGGTIATQRTEWGVALLEVGSSRDALQEQYALRDSLDLMGIPYRATRVVEEAARHRLVLIGGLMLNTQLSPAQREVLYGFVERGGVLLATQVQGSQFFPLFGLAKATTSRTNFRVRFTSTDDPSVRYLNRPEEKVISLGDSSLYSETVWSTEYLPSSGTQVLARYENGSAALTRNSYGRGLAYALGLGFKETTLIPQLARSFEAARRFINWFEPSGDVFRLFLRGLYEGMIHPFLLVHTVPGAKQTALCLSHDVDAQEAFHNSVAFARMESGLGVRSTFFIATKYFKDEADIGYYTPERMDFIRQVSAMGFEIGSHSVSHAWKFEEFPLGSPKIDFQSYDALHPTVFGEVRVSKQLLDRDLHRGTVGFRSGYLRYPNELLRALEESGYTYDSSVSAQWVLTNFPHFGFRQRALGSERSQIVVVPVTMDDSKGELKTRDFLTSSTLDEAVKVWMDVIEANRENNAVSCLLIHPTDATYKLDTERRLIGACLGKDIWVGDVGSVAHFWRDRSRLHPEVRMGNDGNPTIMLNLARKDLPSGQTLVIERNGGSSIPRILDVAGQVIEAKVRPAEDRLFLVLP
ncbi:MAG TPA: polysaccharide deacetylase family protein [Acidobacteriota bacterium]|nr:polysaccharide deacetylase family protein [Acidobacteriota bacterium]